MSAQFPNKCDDKPCDCNVHGYVNHCGRCNELLDCDDDDPRAHFCSQCADKNRIDELEALASRRDRQRRRLREALQQARQYADIVGSKSDSVHVAVMSAIDAALAEDANEND